MMAQTSPCCCTMTHLMVRDSLLESLYACQGC